MWEEVTTPQLVVSYVGGIYDTTTCGVECERNLRHHNLWCRMWEEFATPQLVVSNVGGISKFQIGQFNTFF